ncbi:hypothetical protein E4U21_004730 [Claviceps maximensis]|nr:hypothetical protein E4U21_004730 [Claviceps maximensis]
MRLFSIVALAGLATAYVEMTYPPPFRSRFNRYSTNIDYNMTTPLAHDGSNFPCKGYHSLFDTPQGHSVATWQQGRSYTISLEGTTANQGGSCQLSMSYNNGKDWNVLHSFIGGCPQNPSWSFNVPGDAPPGEALFAWTWFNRFGDRDMYMNCAHVTIQGTPLEPHRALFPLNHRPKMFVANVGNNCVTPDYMNVRFPAPGPELIEWSDHLADPIGDCRYF